MNTTLTPQISTAALYGNDSSRVALPAGSVTQREAIPTVPSADQSARASSERSGALAFNRAAAGQRGDTASEDPQSRRADSEEPQTGLTEQEQAQVRELAQRDREVRAHEQAHRAAAGGLVRGATSYGYQRGPDGRQYAVSGEVSIDTSPVAGDPEATVAKAQAIRRAALAPAQPSGQDLRVAAQAVSMEQQARAEAMRAEIDSRLEQNGASGESSDDSSISTRSGSSSLATGSCPLCGGSHDQSAHSEASLAMIGARMQSAYSPSPDRLGFNSAT